MSETADEKSPPAEHGNTPIATFKPGVDARNTFFRVNDKIVSAADFLKMNPLKVVRFYVICCTDLTELTLPAATSVVAIRCTALTTLHALAAAWVDVNGCTKLTTLDAPAAGRLIKTGCTALTSVGSE